MQKDKGLQYTNNKPQFRKKSARTRVHYDWMWYTIQYKYKWKFVERGLQIVQGR